MKTKKTNSDQIFVAIAITAFLFGGIMLALILYNVDFFNPNHRLIENSLCGSKTILGYDITPTIEIIKYSEPKIGYVDETKHHAISYLSFTPSRDGRVAIAVDYNQMDIDKVWHEHREYFVIRNNRIIGKYSGIFVGKDVFDE